MSRDPWLKQLRVAGNDSAAVSALLAVELPADGLQHAGHAILSTGGSAGIEPVTTAVVAGPVERGWVGDHELATELEHRLTGAGSALVPVAVDLDELGEALDESPASTSYLDLDSGTVWPGELLDLDQGPHDFDPDDPTRWLLVQGLGPRPAYEVIERFISTIANPALASRLNDAIVGSGAFRRFLTELERHSEEFTRWHRFRDDARLGRARHWLATRGYRPIS